MRLWYCSIVSTSQFQIYVHVNPKIWIHVECRSNPLQVHDVRQHAPVANRLTIIAAMFIVQDNLTTDIRENRRPQAAVLDSCKQPPLGHHHCKRRF